jgi:hypothetical protein
MQRVVRNNLAWDLKRSASEVWLVGPKLRHLDKNNLASEQVLIGSRRCATEQNATASPNWRGHIEHESLKSLDRVTGLAIKNHD